jgi:large subunit ribosomal protein L24
MKIKLKKGDQVKILFGKDKGKKAKIEKVFPKTGMVLLPGINLVKKHVKPQGEGKPGGIIEMPKPIASSKVALICPRCHQPTRVGLKPGKESKKIRICRKCQQTL